MYTAMMVEKTTSMTPLTMAVPTLAAVPKTSPAVPIKAVHALGERVAYVGEDLIPVYVAEVGGEGEVKGLEHPVAPGDDVVHIVRHLRNDRADRLHQAREI